MKRLIRRFITCAFLHWVFERYFSTIMALNEADRIVKEKMLSKFCDGYIFVGKDKTCLPKYYAKFADSIRNFEIRDDDIFIATYPKSGTTWAQEMIWMIGNDLDFERGQKNFSERFPFLEICCLGDMEIEEEPDFIKNSVEFSKQMESPRFIKTHLPFSLLPDQIRNGSKKPKIIYVMRNPKDVCVSYYYHHRIHEEIQANLEEFTKVFMSGKETYGPFWKHILGYWEHKDSPNMLFIKYEDMKKDIKAVMKTVARFINKELNDEQLERLAKHLSFESMKNNASIGYDDYLEKRRKEGHISVEGSFFRSGTVGQYKEELSAEMIDTLNQWIKSNISCTSFEQEYDYKL